MKLSKKGRYAVTAMMDLALHSDRGTITLNNISVGKEISMSYMEQLFAQLRRHGLVKGTRGPGGGYRLARSPREISIAEILNAVNDSADDMDGDGNGVDRSLSHELWTELSERIYGFLEQMTLAQFIEGPAKEKASRRLAEHTGAEAFADLAKGKTAAIAAGSFESAH